MADNKGHIGGVTDLTGFPIGERERLELERIRRVSDPNFDGGVGWEEMKHNAERSKQLLAEFQQPNKIPESLFVKHWLAMFAAMYAKDPAVEEVLNSSNILYRWIQVAGQPYRPVNVHKDNDPDRVLFTVPPIFHRTRTIRNLDPGVCFLAFIHKAQQINAKSPHAGQRFYNETLDQFAPRDSREHFLADQVQWLVIFDHYGVLLWDERTKTHRSVKDLKALEGIELYRQAAAAGTTAAKQPAIRNQLSKLSDNEDF